MDIILPLSLSIIAAYLIGAIPTAYIFGRWLKGLDIRQHGSGNMGATNAFRVLGKGPGTAVLLIDIIKGIIPVAVIAPLLGVNQAWALVLVGFVAVCGHNWTVFLQFKGGKGIATSLGVIIGLSFLIKYMGSVLFWTLLSWTAVFLLTGYVSLASIIAAMVFPIMATLIYVSIALPIKVMAIVLCVFVVVRHRSNIQRLLQGKENRVVIFKKK